MGLGDEAGAASAGMSLEEQRAAAEAIRQELGIADDAGATEVDPHCFNRATVALSTVLPVL